MIIISCYYEIPSKQSKEFYYENIKRFFRKLSWQKIYFFTDQSNYDSLKILAGKNVNFIIQAFENIPIFKDFSPEFWKKEILNDPEKYHTWQLGALWACKSYFVRQVSDMYFGDEWFVWVDAGCVRTESWNLDDFTRRNVISQPGVYLQLLNNLSNKEFFQYGGGSYIAGSHILFHKSLISNFIENYKQTINKYIENKLCIIDDQYIIASMIKTSVFLKPIIFNGICPDRWFFMFYVI
jgi:hypothetical protein